MRTICVTHNCAQNLIKTRPVFYNLGSSLTKTYIVSTRAILLCGGQAATTTGMAGRGTTTFSAFRSNCG